MADAVFYIWLQLSFFVLTEDASPASFSETSSSTDEFYRYSLEKAGEKASIRGTTTTTTTTTTSIDRQRVTWPTSVLVTTKSKFKSSHAVTMYYNNFTATFRPMLKLMFDIELNPGPSDYCVDARKKNINNVKIAHLNVRHSSTKITLFLLKCLSGVWGFYIFEIF